jgi:hypothetical protein
MNTNRMMRSPSRCGRLIIVSASTGRKDRVAGSEPASAEASAIKKNPPYCGDSL